MNDVDPTRPLANHRRELFAQNLCQGMSAAAAYVAAGYSDRGARQSAARLLSKADVYQRLEHLRSVILDDGILTAKQVLVELSNIARNASDRERIAALNALAKYHGLFVDRIDHTTKGDTIGAVSIYIPDNGRDARELS